MNLRITEIKSYLPEVTRKIELPGNETGTPRIESKKTLSEMALTVSQMLDYKKFQNKKGLIIFASASLPVDDNESVANRLQHDLGLPKETMTLQLTGGCYISMQALEVAKGLLSTNLQLEYALIVTAEKFSHLVSEKTKKQRQSSLMWSDGASAMALENSDQGVVIDNYTVHTDGESWFDCKIEVGEKGRRQWAFAETQENLYGDDSEKALGVIYDCLKTAQIDCSDLNGVIVLNRSRGFARNLVKGLKCVNLPIIESFISMGHAGCSDLLYNIEQVMSSPDVKGKFLIYTCGYGYVRSASLLNI